MLLRTWSNRTLIRCWGECKMGAFTLELNVAVSYRTKHSITPSFTQRGWKLCPHKNLHMDAYSSFIHSCQILETTKMSFRRWMYEWTIVHPDNGIFFSAKMKWAIKPWKDMKNLTFILLCEKSQSKKAMCCIISTIWHSGKDKTMTVKLFTKQ